MKAGKYPNMHCKKYLQILKHGCMSILSILVWQFTNAQTLAVWSFENHLDSPDYVVEGIEASSMVRGNGLSFQGGAFGPGCDESLWAIQMSGWTTDAKIDASDFYQFSLTPQPGTKLSIPDIKFLAYRNSTGPRKAVIRSSLDNFQTDISKVIEILPNQCNDYLIPLGEEFTELNKVVTFRIYGFDAIDNNGTFLLDNVGSHEMLLPFFIDDFQAKQNNSNIQLTWHTSSVSTDDQWEIQHSRDGINFTSLNVQDITDSEETDFSYLHINPGGGMHYYRLALINNNGGYHFSNVVGVQSIQPDMHFIAWPNPFSSSLKLSFDAEVSVSKMIITNALGQVVFSQSDALDQAVQIQTDSWAKGIYFVRLSSSSGDFFTRLIKQ